MWLDRAICRRFGCLAIRAWAAVTTRDRRADSSAGCCTIFSIFGVVILVGTSSLFNLVRLAARLDLDIRCQESTGYIVAGRQYWLKRRAAECLACRALESADWIAFGSFYARHVEALAGSVNDAPDPDKVARACYGAAVLYAIFVGFCGLQVSLTSFLLSASWWLYGRQQRDPVAIGGCASHADGTDGGAPAFPAGCSVILDSADVLLTRPM